MHELVALMTLAWQPSFPNGGTVIPARWRHEAFQRVALPTRLLQEDEASAEDTDTASRSEYIRSGGFINGRPPDDLDKLSTFSFSEVELPGQIIIGLAGILLTTFIGYLILA